jgi:hypothetical protein
MMMPRVAQKAAFSALLLSLFAIKSRYPDAMSSDGTGIVLLILAALPWLDSILKVAELPGGWKIEFRELQHTVAEQQELINQLVKFSMSASIFTHLCGVAMLHKYNYIDNDGNRREFYFLRDNGFIRPRGGAGWLEFDKRLDARNVNEIAEPTPIGLTCVRLRKSEIPANILTDLGNLKLRLNAL